MRMSGLIGLIKLGNMRRQITLAILGVGRSMPVVAEEIAEVALASFSH